MTQNRRFGDSAESRHRRRFFVRKKSSRLGPSDAELSRRVRQGDPLAIVELWMRHGSSSSRLARTFTPASGEAEELAFSAFSSTAKIIRRGLGPYVFFRAYVFALIRAEVMQRHRWTDAARGESQPAHGSAHIDSRDRKTLRKAFNHLSEIDRGALWYSTIDGESTESIALFLGLDATAVPAIVARAERRFQMAIVRTWGERSPGHPLTRDFLKFVTGDFTNSKTQLIRDHLRTCASCKTVATRIRDVGLTMQTAVLPVVVGSSAAGAYVARATIWPSGARRVLTGQGHVLKRLGEFTTDGAKLRLASAMTAVVAVVAASVLVVPALRVNPVATAPGRAFSSPHAPRPTVPSTSNPGGGETPNPPAAPSGPTSAPSTSQTATGTGQTRTNPNSSSSAAGNRAVSPPVSQGPAGKPASGGTGAPGASPPSSTLTATGTPTLGGVTTPAGTAPIDGATSTPKVGQSVTLIATSTQDVGPTPFGMSIIDASTGSVKAHVGSGTTMSFTVSEAVASVHRYVAQIDSHGSSDVQAISPPVIVSWSDPTVPVSTTAALNPTSGPSAGATLVTLTGTNFAPGDTVKFGSVQATHVIVVSATSLTATAPAGIGVIDVTVTGPGGTSALSNADKYTYIAATSAPVVTSISPSSGPSAGGTQVQIGGTNFAVGDTVRFGAQQATTVVVASPTSLTATAPMRLDASPGNTVDVTVANGTATSLASPADQYTYTLATSALDITLTATPTTTAPPPAHPGSSTPTTTTATTPAATTTTPAAPTATTTPAAPTATATTPAAPTPAAPTTAPTAPTTTSPSTTPAPPTTTPAAPTPAARASTPTTPTTSPPEDPGSSASAAPATSTTTASPPTSPEQTTAGGPTCRPEADPAT